MIFFLFWDILRYKLSNLARKCFSENEFNELGINLNTIHCVLGNTHLWHEKNHNTFGFVKDHSSILI